ncbi:MAG: MCE family protein, partial [Bacteroidetes bacterium]|nr:MCE family protein [Bacteroidota bacterium]
NIIDDINNGKGAAGAILHDDKVALNLKDAMKHINAASMQADNMVNNLDSIVNGLQNDMDHGPGAVRAVLKDSALTNKLNNSLDNIEKGTAAFNEDMEALKHNFLLKGYFKKQARKKKN